MTGDPTRFELIIRLFLSFCTSLLVLKPVLTYRWCGRTRNGKPRLNSSKGRKGDDIEQILYYNKYGLSAT
jgi:hypothetical protein